MHDRPPGVTHDQFYIVAAPSRGDERKRVLKQGDTFAVFDHHGDVVPGGQGELGLYHAGTRFLSRFEFLLGDVPMMFLSAAVRRDNAGLSIDLSNPDMRTADGTEVPRGTLHVFRCRFLADATCHEHVRLTNFGDTELRVPVTFRFEADFVDIFEVRGTPRARRGTVREPRPGKGGLVLSYMGLDRVERRTLVEWNAPGTQPLPGVARFDVTLAPRTSWSLELRVRCAVGDAEPASVGFHAARAALVAALERDGERWCTLSSSSEAFDEWIGRSRADLQMMITDTPDGPYPYAGVPWFSTEFGRDGIITAMQLLWANPDAARGVLSFLAATQAREENAAEDAEPGKILHEARRGEMAALGEVPFGRYYGTVDATPLFVMLAGMYWRRTADRAFLGQLWPHVERALLWIEKSGDLDGDGFVEYSRRTTEGLANQGWKDSQDSVMHADGRLAAGPIALCEVQGYVYGAWRAAAELSRVLGEPARADEYDRRASALAEAFDRAYWCEDIGTYALALDGEKRRCAVRSSNAGQCLFTGIVRAERAAALAEQLLSEHFFTGWGIRTLGAGEPRYNPMSYHDGSVWPHDNALIAAGLARYGHVAAAVRVMHGLFDVSGHVEERRLPELFCGFKRRPGEGPTLYPVACAPQAWAAGSVFMLLGACAGLELDAPRGEIRLVRPHLPPFLRRLEIGRLRVGGAEVDLVLERHAASVGVNVARREGDVRIVSWK